MHSAERPLPGPQRQEPQDLRHGPISISDLPQHDPKTTQLVVSGESLGSVGELFGLAEIAVPVEFRLQAGEQLIALVLRLRATRGFTGISGAQPRCFPEEFAAALASVVGATVTP